MQEKRNRPVSAARRRLPIFPGVERPPFRTIIKPLNAKERNMAIPGADVRYNANNALHSLAQASKRLKQQFEELRHLREAVAEAERASRKQRPQARRLSGNPRGASPS